MTESLDSFSFETLSYHDSPSTSNVAANHIVTHTQSSIGAGVTFGRRAQELARPIREAVDCFIEMCEPNAAFVACAEYLAIPSDLDIDDDHSSAMRLGWWLSNVFLLEGRRSREYSGRMVEALCSFLGNRKIADGLLAHLPTRAINALEELLSSVKMDDEFIELLPYILEPFGPGSRHSVMRDNKTTVNREAKKASGVFYTPLDVASYMIREANVEYGLNWRQTTTYDPACGTGVFLIEQAKEVKRTSSGSITSYVSRQLFGSDICAISVDSAAFGLLHACLDEEASWAGSAYSLWRTIRTNVLTSDALNIVGSQLNEGRSAAGVERSIPMLTLFKNLKELPGILVGNPPYAALGDRTDFFSLQRRFNTYRSQSPKASDALHLLFVEQMWLLSNPKHAATALVLPLSITYGSDKLQMSCRVGMMQSGMEWRCANFDREPHALFGEDVKTRNSIVFGRRTSTELPRPGLIGTTALMRWTSRSRHKLFENIRFTYLRGCDYAVVLPKLDGESQARAYIAIASHEPKLAKHIQASRATPLAEISDLSFDETTIFVAPTAYNFINVFRASDLWANELVPLSESPVTALTFASCEEAAAAHAILSSRLTYWLWTVLGDGFHVTKKFIESLPAWSDPLRAQLQLCRLGEQMWSELQKDVIRSINKGRTTIAFRPTHCARTQTEIDTLLQQLWKLPNDFPAELEDFSEKQRIVDPNDKTRTEQQLKYAK